MLNPNLKNTYTTEFSGWVEHELVPGFALQGGYVYRRIGDIKVQVNQNRPMEAYNIPISIRDPGADGVLGNADDGPNIPEDDHDQPDRVGDHQPLHQRRRRR